VTPEHPRIAALRSALARRPAGEPVPELNIARAAVALLLRPAGGDVELLLIRRAEREGDPWSGHVALPGGREQADDATPAHTAARETREEVGIDVRTGGRLLGPLPPVWPRGARAPGILVRPFVFAVPREARATPNEEVDGVVWVPVDELRHPGAVTEHLMHLDDSEPMRFPAIGARGYVVWGLTHRILTDFLEIVENVV
jgi:8-oxo-dGTP pyrophosphatase MutT (NUDIX family)